MSGIPTLGPVGLWTAGLDTVPTGRAAEVAAEIEELGYGTLWLSEGLVRDPFVHAAGLLSATSRLVVGTGVAITWGRHPRIVRAQARALHDAHPGRFALGLGASHARYVEGVLGLEYRRPLAHLRDFVDRLDEPDPVLALAGVAPSDLPPQPRLLAALGPAALRQARERADGAITYLVTPEHTAAARAALGPDRTLVVEQAVVVGHRNEVVLGIARDHVAGYLPAEPYRRSWLRLGFTEDDVDDGASERLTAALVAVGAAEVDRRVAAHHAAGADHVCLQALGPDSRLPLASWRELASRPPTTRWG